MSDVAKHIAVSKRVDLNDLDWELARQHGLSDREVECLGYFADVESQTVYYFLEVAKLKALRHPDFLAFLTIWNYEEYFHSHAITQLLNECGIQAGDATARSSEVRAGARLKARIEDGLQTAMASLAPNTFMSLWLTWGSINELLTSQAYEQIASDTENPVCAEVCRRIAKQERRHFAYYYNSARLALEGRPITQKVVRYLVDKMWEPVGNGVKTPVEAAQLARRLFPGPRFFEVLRIMDERVSTLPGMQGFDACRRWARRMGLSEDAAEPADRQHRRKVA